VAQPQPEGSKHDPTVRDIAPIASLAGAHSESDSPGAVWFTLCAWCGRLKVRGRWVTVPHAPDRVDASAGRLPLVTHGICPSCFEQATANAARQRRLHGEP
jgi:NMD protein affecting ribosome stability and mRNA decay